MSRARFLRADVFEGLASLPDDSVDLVLTSPPFLALRSYLEEDHEFKDLEIGGEANPAEYIDALLDVVEACDRVLAPHGSLVFELGDTYSGSGGAGGDYNEEGLREGQNAFVGSAAKKRKADGWPLTKSLCGIPQAFELSLIWGRNILRPSRETEPWRVRNLAAWCRPNPAVGRLGDKVRPATSYLTIACKSADRWFDLDAVRHAPLHGLDPDKPMGNNLYRDHPREGQSVTRPDRVSNPAGAPPLDHWWVDDVFDQDAWLLATRPYTGAHYAVWPADLLHIPIESMCPQRVCTACGEPSRRIVDAQWTVDGEPRDDLGSISSTGRGGADADGMGHWRKGTTYTTLGWTECPCPDLTDGGLEIEGSHAPWRNGVVLDPFAGSGTTLMVATGHGRDAIGIDLDEENVELARQRCGMFLTVDEPETV